MPAARKGAARVRGSDLHLGPSGRNRAHSRLGEGQSALMTQDGDNYCVKAMLNVVASTDFGGSLLWGIII
jgi:hypothetical protein